MVRRARSLGWDVVGWPRLVRLDPNVPWKTRGNAALAVHLGHGRGARRTIGELPDGPVVAFERGTAPDRTEREELDAALWETVLTTARSEEPGTDPAMVVTRRHPSPEVYRTAVRDVVSVDDAREAVARVGGRTHCVGSPRGLVGATASLSWPARRSTFELIAYRPPEREATRREVDVASVREVAARFPELFQCYDPRTRRLLVTPHTPCPILFGLRARRPDRLEEAFRGVRSEPVDRWLIFQTNQGTGDHLVSRTGSELRPYSSAKVAGRVAAAPEALRGGRVRFDIVGPDAVPVPCTVFEPTKTLPKVALRLAPGDRVRVWGGRGSDPMFRVEGIEVVGLAPRWANARPPKCPTCGVSTSSRGAARGYRCPHCHRRFPPESARRRRVPAGLATGVYHPTPSARRHLHPLVPAS